MVIWLGYAVYVFFLLVLVCNGWEKFFLLNIMSFSIFLSPWIYAGVGPVYRPEGGEVIILLEISAVL